MDKSRQQFEEWFNSGHGDLPYSEKGKEDLKALLFQSWQASRESLINNLEPVGYITSSGVDNIKEYGYTHLNEEKSEKINIPLYRLDK
ncbi:Uncharacterised protein [Providencia alcalifaciens]|uniref:Uncharacterized protein n=1 Tax=Providencia alcalifaciens DSM 30120 TaxID=520999 RepID=B6XGQ4_9GAMM|nr:hypothetical protein [Providencia alcalifaciens]EEB45451.1 hypothetical protein PROVALCAL_02540 [Providencia alcalifaciens DSM 30120]SQI34671.1 Uncharacterised protein [Providencia alcalifaciens]